MKPVNVQTVDARIEALEHRKSVAGLSLAEEFELQALEMLFKLITEPTPAAVLKLPEASFAEINDGVVPAWPVGTVVTACKKAGINLEVGE